MITKYNYKESPNDTIFQNSKIDIKNINKKTIKYQNCDSFNYESENKNIICKKTIEKKDGLFDFHHKNKKIEKEVKLLNLNYRKEDILPNSINYLNDETMFENSIKKNKIQKFKNIDKIEKVQNNINDIPSRLKHKNLGSILDIWKKEFNIHLKIFRKQVKIIKDQEFKLIENVSKMVYLEEKIKIAVDSQKNINQILERIQIQQKELKESIKEIGNIHKVNLQNYVFTQMNQYQLQRHETYIKVEDIYQELLNLENILTNIIINLNFKNINSKSNSNFSSIVNIFDNHMNAISWINDQVEYLNKSFVKIE